jgi:hypothetical protein
MRVVSIVLLAAALYVAYPVAQTGNGVTGKFSSKGVQFEVKGGVAFTGKSSFDSEMAVILVAITNTGLSVEAIADFVDRKRAIEKLVKDDETPIVYLEFTPQGRWRGLSYYLASGNGCGYCTSEVKSTVKLANGRLNGDVTGTERDRPFNVSLDIPVLSDDHGQALPADGGAPGKAYLAYHAALVKRDGAALKATLSPGNLEVFARAEKSKDVDGYISFLADKHPMKTVKITRGWSTADKASLLIEGASAIGKVSGEVFLINTKGVWGVDEELVDLVIGQ